MHISQNNMRCIYIVILSLLFSINTQAQTAKFDWEQASKWTNTSISGVQNPKYIFPTQEGFTTYSVEEIGTRAYTSKIIYISKFDNTGKYLSSVELTLPKRQLKDATLLKIIEGNNKLYIFSYVALKKDKKNILYAQVYDNTTDTLGDTYELYTLPIAKVNNSGFFNVELSRNRKRFAVLVNKPFVKKTKEEIDVLILDANLELISNVKQQLSFDSKRSSHETLFVENDETVTLIKKTNLNKKSPITTVITIKGQILKEQQVSADNFYISDCKVITVNAKQYLVGFATDNAKPAVSMGGAKDKSYFIYNISENKLVKNQSWKPEILKKVLGKGFIDLKVKTILLDDNDIYIIGDRFSKKSEAIPGQNFEYNYTYNFGPGVVIKLNTEGDIAYESYIKYGEEYNNNMKRLGSFYPFISNGALHILANEKESILKKKKIVMGYNKINAKAIVLKTFNGLGEVSIVPFWNSTVGGEQSSFAFSPSQTIQLTDKVFYIYAFGGDKQAFGRMTIE